VSCAGKSARVLSGAGFVMLLPCVACGHSRCGAECACDGSASPKKEQGALAVKMYCPLAECGAVFDVPLEQTGRALKCAHCFDRTGAIVILRESH
jgi:hypothetical protein